MNSQVNTFVGGKGFDGIKLEIKIVRFQLAISRVGKPRKGKKGLVDPLTFNNIRQAEAD